MIVLTALCADLTLNNLPSKPLTLPDCAASSTWLLKDFSLGNSDKNLSISFLPKVKSLEPTIVEIFLAPAPNRKA